MAGLSDGDRARYARHLTLPQVGEIGQSKLKNSRVFASEQADWALLRFCTWLQLELVT